MASLAKLTIQLDILKDKRAEVEKEFNSKNSMARNGAIAFLIGIALAIFFSFWIGAFLFVIGILAALTNVGKKNKLAKELKSVDDEIKLLRQQMANVADA